MKCRNEGVTIYDKEKAFQGYTLFAPMGCPDTWLMDMEGNMIHHWKMPERPGSYSKLLGNGNLLYGCKMDAEKRKRVGAEPFSGYGGIIREVDWNNRLIWEYEDPFLHHDFYRMKNGNTMVLKWIEVPEEITKKVKGGVPGTEEKGKIWGDAFEEITPEGKVAWSWIAHENLNPELDAICPLCPRKEWTHANSCVVLGNGDLLTCFRSLNNVCIIDRQNGEIKWEWGSGLGQLAHPHDPHPLPNGNIMIFDNGAHRALTEVNCSIVVEVDRQKKEIVWEYRSNPAHLFYSSVCSGAQRLPNGNTLICSTTQGRLFEITAEKEIVWEYYCPYYGEIDSGYVNWIFRAYRYEPDFIERIKLETG